MDPLILALAFATFLSTLIGGAIILRFRSSLPYFFAFAAGSLMAVAFLDILPESIELAGNANLPLRYVMITIIASFFFYHLVERFFVTHDVGEHEEHGHIMGPVGAGSLIIHSLLDGAVIGAAFQVNIATGVVVAAAVLMHDFTDGINTVTLMLKNKQKTRTTVIFLLLDAIAPVIGVMLVSFFTIPQTVLALILAFFVGEFVYIGAATLVPETHHYDTKKTVLIMAGGILLIMGLTALL